MNAILCVLAIIAYSIIMHLDSKSRCKDDESKRINEAIRKYDREQREKQEQEKECYRKNYYFLKRKGQDDETFL